MIHVLLGWVCRRIGWRDAAEEQAVEAFITSYYYSITSMLSLMLLIMYGQGALASWHLAQLWLISNWWPFFLAQYVAPALRARAAANMYAPVPPPKVFVADSGK